MVGATSPVFSGIAYERKTSSIPLRKDCHLIPGDKTLNITFPISLMIFSFTGPDFSLKNVFPGYVVGKVLHKKKVNLYKSNKHE